MIVPTWVACVYLGAGLTVACSSRGHRELQELLDAVERYLGSQDFVLLRAEREVIVPGEL